MINLASADMRLALTIAKCTAFLGNPADGISSLEVKITSSKTAIDQLVALMAICEILHCDYRDVEALDVYEKRVSPIMGSFSEKIEIAVAFNRNDIMRSLWQHDDFYGMVDRATITGVELWDYSTYHNIAEAREQNKRYDSLPTIWRELVRCYYQGCWGPSRLASRLMAVECMDLGWLHKAVYHAINAGEKETAAKLGTMLLHHGTFDTISGATTKWLECTNLKRHFAIGCDLLDCYVDAIPDELFDSVFERVRANASLNVLDRQIHSIVSRAWDSMSKLAWRLDASQSQRLVCTAIEHPIWNSSIEGGDIILPVRDKMMESLSHCCERLPSESVTLLARASLPLARERKQHTDYAHAINLLCKLGRLGSDELKMSLKESLYPPRQALDAFLLQAASHFGVEFGKSESLSLNAKVVASRIRQQVQRVHSSVEVKQMPGTFGFYTFEMGEEKLVVHFSDTVDVLAILRHRKQLSPEAIQELIDAVLEMLRENENPISNKIGLVQAITHMGDSFSDTQAQQIFEVLAPIGNGDISEPESMMSAAESENPLNPFKMGIGKPTDLRGVSIFALACIDREKPEIFATRLDEIIELGLTDADPQVRAFSLASAREKPTISEAEFTAIILATRDGDPSVASAAFGALANKDGLQLSRPQTRLLIHSAKLSLRSNSVQVRRAAAHACTKLRRRITTKTLLDAIDGVVGDFSKDKCKSVRQNTQLNTS